MARNENRKSIRKKKAKLITEEIHWKTFDWTLAIAEWTNGPTTAAQDETEKQALSNNK